MLAEVALSIELILGVYTTHIGGTYDYNNDNNVVGVRVGGVMAGTFENSYRRRTYFFGGYQEWGDDGFFWGQTFGITHGYCWETIDPRYYIYTETCKSTFVPYWVPVIGYRNDPLSVRVIGFMNAINITVGVELNQWGLYEYETVLPDYLTDSDNYDWPDREYGVPGGTKGFGPLLYNG